MELSQGTTFRSTTTEPGRPTLRNSAAPIKGHRRSRSHDHPYASTADDNSRVRCSCWDTDLRPPPAYHHGRLLAETTKKGGLDEILHPTTCSLLWYRPPR